MGTLPYSLQELEQMGRWRTVPAEGSELPTVSGARAGAETGRLASVSRAASSQEPEPGPGEGETKSQMGNSRPGAPAPTQRGLLPTHRPTPVHPGPAAECPSPSLASGSSSSSPLRGCGSGFSSSDSWPPAAPGGRQRSVWRRLKGRAERSQEGGRAAAPYLAPRDLHGSHCPL